MVDFGRLMNVFHEIYWIGALKQELAEVNDLQSKRASNYIYLL